MNKIKIISKLLLLTIPFFIVSCTKQLTCEERGLLQTQVFIERWNKETEKLTTGSWTLPLWQVPKYGEAETFGHSLDGPNLFIKLNVIDSCLSSVDVRAKRDMNIGMASLVSWVKLLKVLVPSVTNQERINFLNNVLGVDKPNLKAGGSGKLGDFEFSFSESIEGNVLHARNGNNKPTD
jgi:hypothetical protein